VTEEQPSENVSDEFEEPMELIEAEQEDLLEAEPVAHQVTYSGQDFDVEGLVRRMNKNDILVPTFGHDDERITTAGFQRSFVWRRPQMDRFIESLLLGYPIPGSFWCVKQTDATSPLMASSGCALFSISTAGCSLDANLPSVMSPNI
jgi:hypothetical protein